MYNPSTDGGGDPLQIERTTKFLTVTQGTETRSRIAPGR